MPFHIHGPLSQTRESPSFGTEVPQGGQGTGSQFLRSPHLFNFCYAPAITL